MPSLQEANDDPSRNGHNSMASLVSQLGVDRKECDQLYRLRCEISHGELAMDPGGIEEAAQKAARIQQLFAECDQAVPGWPVDAPPTIEPEVA